MELLTAVAVSMLPVSRLRACAAFKLLQHLRGNDALEAVLAACRVTDPGASARAWQKAEVALGAAEAIHASPIPWFDARYPPLLGAIADPPPVLWVTGNAVFLTAPAVAVVGSRAATPYALQVGQRLGAELGGRDIAVVSGLARGVDSAAHRGCLDAGGATIAVLGSGLDRIYPAEHRTLAATICKQGCLVSELAPGAAPLPEHFPLRNRIISGISLGVVVVEASENSGSLITARCALQQGRDVMAVPGSVLSGRNRGSHGLLKDGAKVVESADDILEELGWPGAVRTPYSSAKLLESDPLLTRMEPGEVYRLDELIELTGMVGSKLLPRLMELELQGRVARAGSGGFSRTAGSAMKSSGEVW